MKKPEPVKTGDLLRVVDRMPKGVWGYPFSVDPDRWLVPVEPCKHGNIDGHHPYYQTEKMDPTYCPGAEIGDDDA